MAIKLSIVSDFNSKGTKQANAALKEFQKEFKLTKDEMDGGVGTLAAQSVAWEQAGARIEAAGARLGNVGKTLTTTLTLPILAAGAAVAGVAINFETSMSQLEGALNDPQADMESLSSLALKMGQDTIFSATEAGAAMTELAKAGLTDADIQGGALAATMTLAAAGSLALADAATYTAESMGMFGLGAADADAVTTALAGGANASTASVESLAQGLSQAGTVANNMGMNVNETVGALSAFAAEGIKGSDAGTSLKTMLSRLVPMTDDAAMAMENYGLSFQDSSGNIDDMAVVAEKLKTKLGGLSEAERQAALYAIFGSDATRAAAVMMGEGAEGIQGYITATEDQQAAQEMANAAMGDTERSIENMKGNLETAGIALGEGMTPIIQDAAGQVGTLAEGFSNLTDEEKESTLKTLAFTAAAGPVISIVGKVTSGIGSVVTASGKLKGWMAKVEAQAVTGTIKNKIYAASVKGIGTAAGIAGAAIGTALVAKIAVSGLEITSLGDSIRSASKEFDSAIKNTESFGDALANAHARTLDTDTALSTYGASLGELDDTVSTAQNNITTIISTSLSEQRQLRDDEIASILDYNVQLAAALGQKTDMYISSLGTEYDMVMSETGKLTTDEAAEYIASIDAKGTEATDAARTAYETQLSELTRFHEAEGTINSGEYKSQKEALSKSYDDKLTEIEFYSDKAKRATATHVESMSKTESDAWAAMADATKDYSYSSMNSLEKAAVGLTEFIGTNNWTEAEYKAALADMDMTTASSFLSMQSTVVDSGGTITDANMEIAANILSAYDDMPPGMDAIAKEALLAMTAGMESQWPWLANSANMTADQIVDAIRAELGGTYTEGADAGQGAADGLSSKDTTLYQTGLTSGGKLKAGVSDGVLGTYTVGFRSGADANQGFADGMASKYSVVSNAAYVTAGLVHDKLGFSVPKEGPLSDADEYGPDFAKLFAGGIIDNLGVVSGAADRMASAAYLDMAVPGYSVNARSGNTNSSGGVTSNGSVNYTYNITIDGSKMPSADWDGLLSSIQTAQRMVGVR